MIEIEILKKVNCPNNVINHCMAVYKKSMEIASNFNDVDQELLKKGALLHDIGRSKTHNLEHAIEGAKIARKLDYSYEVCSIIEKHIGAGITENEAVELGLPEKSYMPKTLEEKIVAHADNLLHGTKEVDLNFVINKWERKIENPRKNIKRLILLNQELVEQFKE